MGTSQEDHCTFLIIFSSVLLKRRNVSDKFVEKINKHILCSATFFPSQNRTVYETMWQNIADPSRQQMTIWRMRIAGLITKATNKHTITMCNTYVHCCPTATTVTRTRLNVTLYAHCLSCFKQTISYNGPILVFRWKWRETNVRKCGEFFSKR